MVCAGCMAGVCRGAHVVTLPLQQGSRVLDAVQICFAFLEAVQAVHALLVPDLLLVTAA
jgi:hypothetical protein